MSKETGKKKWEKPKLTIVTRGNPEEGVLAICKTSGGMPQPNPSRQYSAGHCEKWQAPICVDCNTTAAS